MTLVERVKKLLHDLGANARAVAEKLHREGIRGTPGEPCHCPIAEYLSRHIGIGCSVSSESSCIGDGEIIVRNPVAVRRFIVEFDEGRHEQLCAAYHPPSEAPAP